MTSGHMTCHLGPSLRLTLYGSEAGSGEVQRNYILYEHEWEKLNAMSH